MEDRLVEVRKKIMSFRNINEDFRLLLILLVNNINLPDKKIKVFLKFENNKVAIGFLFRLIISSAYKYEVPMVYINSCIENKKRFESMYKYKHSFNYSEDDIYEVRSIMQSSYRSLLIATLELIRRKNSRKEKISKVLEKIEI